MLCIYLGAHDGEKKGGELETVCLYVRVHDFLSLYAFKAQKDNFSSCEK